MTFRSGIREWNVYFFPIKRAVNKNILDLRQTAKPICCERRSSGWYVRSDGHVEKKRWHKGSTIPYGISDGIPDIRCSAPKRALYSSRVIGLNPLSQQSRWNVSDALITHKCQPAWFLESGQRVSSFHYLGNPSFSLSSDWSAVVRGFGFVAPAKYASQRCAC